SGTSFGGCDGCCFFLTDSASASARTVTYFDLPRKISRNLAMESPGLPGFKLRPIPRVCVDSGHWIPDAAPKLLSPKAPRAGPVRSAARGTCECSLTKYSESRGEVATHRPRGAGGGASPGYRALSRDAELSPGNQRALLRLQPAVGGHDHLGMGAVARRQFPERVLRADDDERVGGRVRLRRRHLHRFGHGVHLHLPVKGHLHREADLKLDALAVDQVKRGVQHFGAHPPLKARLRPAHGDFEVELDGPGPMSYVDRAFHRAPA